MSVQFILGAPGTGKTTYVLEEIRKKIAAGETVPLCYLVPEQFSLQSERLLLDGSLGLKAATKIQVLSFNRLAHRLFSVLGGRPHKHADDIGKQMLLRKVLFEASDELEYYKRAADKPGFINELSHTITEMHLYCVSADDLTDRAVHSPKTLAAKLRDTAKILTKYREAVTGRYLLTDGIPELLCKKIAEFDNKPLPLLDGAYFWVDGFTGFTPQERQILFHIEKRAKKIMFTLTVNEKISQAPNETIEKILKSANDILPHIYMKENFRHTHSKGLNFFSAHFGAARKISQEHDGIEIISCADKYAEVYTAAHKILTLINEEHYRFRDIAVLCGDRSRYEKILQTVFDRLQIPMFVDTETDILSHPLTEMIRAALEIIIRNWGYEEVFRFLKTRLTGIPQETVDILENYALANGVGSFRWRYTFTDEAAENGRIALINALSVFGKMRADSKDTVKNHARRMFEMLYTLNVPIKLQEWSNMHGGDPAAARQHAQIWNKLCEVFDKLVDILSDEAMTLKTFAATLDAGLCQAGLGRIPPTLDQIVLGDISRSRYPQIKAMIVLGANDGAMPKAPAQAGLLTDRERKILKNSALELSNDNSQKINEQNFSLYCALSQPREKLIFIYSERPASIIVKIRKLFPSLKTSPAPLPPENTAENSIFFAPVMLSQNTAGQLYGRQIYTAATRLEAFARCPFAYYMNYILSAKPRKLYEVLPTDLGRIFHDVIAEFTKRGEFNFSRGEISKVVNEAVNSMDTENSVFHSTARNKYILDKTRRVASATCWAICEQIKNGQYRPAMIEHDILTNIALDDGINLSLHGRVDRVDILNAGGTEHIKIIDYKTGGGKFSVDEVLKGVQLQLMLYMDAITESRKSAIPGGVFYFPIDDPIINADEILPDAVREENILNSFKLSGADADGIDFKQFGADVNKKVKELGTRMTKGDIAAAPYTKGQKSPCKYCKFTSVCGEV